MKIKLFTPSDLPPHRERNFLGRSEAGLTPQHVAESLAAALTEAGFTVQCFHNKRGWGDGHDQWDITFGGAVFQELLVLEHARLAKMSQRSRDEFAKKSPVFGIFVRADRENGTTPWNPCEVAIYYTLKGRALTALRKQVSSAIEIEA